METVNKIGIRPMTECDYKGKTVLLRVDINCPVDAETRRLRNTNRINKSARTLKYLMDQGARVVIIAHNGDNQEYKGIIPLTEHAEILSAQLGKTVRHIDDTCGPAAQEAIKQTGFGEAILLGNLRYLSEELTAFEFALKLEPGEFKNCYLMRSLLPLVDCYVNDAFSAAHRNSPSLTAFPEFLPTAAGFLLFEEVEALAKVLEHPTQPAVYLLGGNRISDAFGMMDAVLSNGSAHRILTCGLTGVVMLIAKGCKVGANALNYIKKNGFEGFIQEAATLLGKYGNKILIPEDLAIARDGKRREISIKELPLDEDLFDIGSRSIELYKKEIGKAGTVFVNGPPGVYENPLFEKGTRDLFLAVQDSPAFTVIGGGDSVTAATKYVDLKKISHICTAGGAMVQYLSGQEMPLIKAMRKAYTRWK
jgi:phosphoglycerate kinase